MYALPCADQAELAEFDRVASIDLLLSSRYNDRSIHEDAEQALSGRAGGALEGMMSLTPMGGRSGLPGPDEIRQKVTAASLREQKLRHEPITCLLPTTTPPRAWSMGPESR